MKNKLKILLSILLISLSLTACSKNLASKNEFKNDFVGSPKPSLEQSQVLTADNKKYIGKSIFLEIDESNISKSPDDTNEPIAEESYEEKNILENNKLVKVEINGDKDKFQVPGIILTPNSPLLFSLENDMGFDLNKGDKITFQFEKYPSEIIEEQSLLVGLIKDDKTIHSDIFKNISDNFEYEIETSGVYYLFVESFSSDYLSLYDSEIQIERAK